MRIICLIALPASVFLATDVSAISDRGDILEPGHSSRRAENSFYLNPQAGAGATESAPPTASAMAPPSATIPASALLPSATDKMPPPKSALGEAATSASQLQPNTAQTPTWEHKIFVASGSADKDKLQEFLQAGWVSDSQSIDPLTGNTQFHLKRLVQPPVTGEIKIISAVFGDYEDGHGLADVTAVVKDLVGPGKPTVFASPKWMQIDPAYGWKKNIVIVYEYRGVSRTYNAIEGGPIGYEELIKNAGGTIPPPPTPAGGDRVQIVSAFYGTGMLFTDVTARVTELTKPGSPPFTVDVNTLQADPTPGLKKEFIVVYDYNGVRKTFTSREYLDVSSATLIANAKN